MRLQNHAVRVLRPRHLQKQRRTRPNVGGRGNRLQHLLLRGGRQPLAPRLQLGLQAVHAGLR